jgi:hypothetical protein
MFKELPDQRRRDILHRKMIDWRLEIVGRKRQQQNERIPIAQLRIARQISLGNYMLQQKAADPGSNQFVVTHGRAPAGRSARIVDLPPAEVQASS